MERSGTGAGGNGGDGGVGAAAVRGRGVWWAWEAKDERKGCGRHASGAATRLDRSGRGMRGGCAAGAGRRARWRVDPGRLTRHPVSAAGRAPPQGGGPRTDGRAPARGEHRAQRAAPGLEAEGEGARERHVRAQLRVPALAGAHAQQPLQCAAEPGGAEGCEGGHENLGRHRRRESLGRARVAHAAGQQQRHTGKERAEAEGGGEAQAGLLLGRRLRRVRRAVSVGRHARPGRTQQAGRHRGRRGAESRYREYGAVSACEAPGPACVPRPRQRRAAGGRPAAAAGTAPCGGVRSARSDATREWAVVPHWGR